MKQLLKFLVSIAMVGFAIYLLDVQAMTRMLGKGAAASFGMAVMVNILTFLVLGARWYKLVISRVQLPFLIHLAVYFKATFLNTFTPANLGGDAYRLAALRSGTVSGGELVSLLLRERILGFYGYVIVFAAAYFLVQSSLGFNMQLAGNPYIYGVMVVVGAFILPLVIRPLGHGLVFVLRNVIETERLPKLECWVDAAAGLLSPTGTRLPMLLTFGGVLLWVVSIKIVAEGFGLSISLVHLAAVATLVELVRLVPVTVQGIGLREGVFAYLLAFLGYSPEQCYVVGTVAYLALSLAIVLCGPIGHVLMWRERANA